MRPRVVSYNGISNDPNYYGKKIVEMEILDEYTLFDWCKVIENSLEIHTIDTSLILLIEKIITNKTKLNLYGRASLDEVTYLLKQNWTLK
jgi:hypothetical protein